jgi:hypothetical protein
MAAAGGGAAANRVDAKLLAQLTDGVEVVRFDEPGCFPDVLRHANFVA